MINAHSSASLGKYLFVPLAAFLVTYLAAPLCMRLARRVGLMDQPGGRRQHEKATPLCGGLAVFLGLIAGLVAAFFMPWGKFGGSIGIEHFWPFLALASLVMIVGVVDDRFELPAWYKLAGQVAVATLAYALGTRFDNALGFALPEPLTYLATVLWLVGAMNAFNLIDGMDGLATGLGLIGAAGLCLHSLFSGSIAEALWMLALAGSCLAFLRYNFHPAQAFLGDAGSMLLGFVLAWIALETNNKSTAVTALLVPVLAMGVPILDTILAIWRRAARRVHGQLSGGEEKAQVFGADREHLHHRLRDAGFSQRKVALVLYAFAAILVVLGLASTTRSSYRSGILVATFAVFSYVVIKHLAHVELWASGRAVVQGMRRPPSAVVAVLLYPLLDVIVLGAAVLGVLLLWPHPGDTGLKRDWIELAPASVGIPFLVLALTRTYQRVWSRARVSEYGMLAVSLLLGLAVAAEISGRMQVEGWRERLHWFFTYTGLALVPIMGLRVLPRLFQDSLLLFHRHRDEDEVQRVLLYGAGAHGTLFLREHSFKEIDSATQWHIHGFIDDDTNLRGRIVHSYNILGTLGDLEAILERRRTDMIVVTTDIKPQNRERLREIGRERGVHVMEWRPELLPLEGGGSVSGISDLRPPSSGLRQSREIHHEGHEEHEERERRQKSYSIH